MVFFSALGKKDEHRGDASPQEKNLSKQVLRCVFFLFHPKCMFAIGTHWSSLLALRGIYIGITNILLHKLVVHSMLYHHHTHSIGKVKLCK